MNDKQLDKLFRDSLEHAEATPPDGIWKNIDAQLGKRRNTPLKRMYSWRGAAAIALCMLTGLLCYRVLQPEHEIQTARVGHIERPHNDTQPITDPAENSQTEQLPQPQATTVLQRPSLPPPPKKRNAPVGKSPGSEPLRLSELALASLSLSDKADSVPARLPTHRVVEVGPIQPLVENPEEEDAMLAGSRPPERGLVTTLLNKVTEIVNPDDSKTIHFSKDDEGSFRVDIYHSLVKNKRKRR